MRAVSGARDRPGRACRVPRPGARRPNGSARRACGTAARRGCAQSLERCRGGRRSLRSTCPRRAAAEGRFPARGGDGRWAGKGTGMRIVMGGGASVNSRKGPQRRLVDFPLTGPMAPRKSTPALAEHVLRGGAACTHQREQGNCQNHVFTDCHRTFPTDARFNIRGRVSAPSGKALRQSQSLV